MTNPTTITDAMVEAAARASYSMWQPGIPWESLDDTSRDQAHHVARNILEAAERAAWQPIETAPRDGSPVLVCSGDRMRWAVWSAGFWRDGQKSAGGEICGCPVPTHWRPLPGLPGGE